MAKVRFKFKASADAGERRRVVEQLKQAGASHVTPLFPGDDDPELADLYSAEVAGGTVESDAIAQLNKNSAVQFAEADVKRKLIKPK